MPCASPQSVRPALVEIFAVLLLVSICFLTRAQNFPGKLLPRERCPRERTSEWRQQNVVELQTRWNVKHAQDRSETNRN